MTLHPIQLAIATFALGLAMQCEPATAQRPDAGLMLAKVMVNEAGFDAPADHLAIARYTRSLARHWGAPIDVAMARRYTRALAPAEQRSNRPWLADLSRSLARPAGWRETGPNAMPWESRRSQWEATLARADAFLAGEIDAPEGCRPQSWGSPEYDREQIESTIANGGYVVACGPTRNVFLRFGGAR